VIVPGWYGMANVKWLASITVASEPFGGYQQERAYRLRRNEADEGEPLTRMLPRALMVPPGVPHFLPRERVLSLAPCRLEGRAWSGFAPIAGVEVSADGGETWTAAALDGQAPDSSWAWRRWTFEWHPRAPGEHVLACRARDEAGNVQPTQPTWNVGGYANNAVQRVRVTVTL
jgi:DMSO/TMAO reductase YedYZ molybdopterin-dependent catalytic subunit